MNTKLDYMHECLNQWEWLSENPSMSKWEYRQFHDVERLKNGCPACEWASRGSIDVDCSKCFLNNYAWTPEKYACEKAEDSPYRIWNDTDDEDDEDFIHTRRTSALSMVRAIKMAIADEVKS